MHLLSKFIRYIFIRNVLYFVLIFISCSFQIEIPLKLSSISNHANYIRYSGMLKSVDYKLLTGEFFIGTPKQSLNLLLDTTSSISWIPKSNLNNFFMHTFDPSRSKTFFNLGTSQHVPYEDLNQKGELSSDVLDFTSKKRNKQLTPSFHFVLVDSEEEPNSKIVGFDGTMSLLRHDNIKNIQLKSFSHNESISFPEYLAQEHVINKNKFAIEYLPNNRSTLYIDEEELINEIISNRNNTSGSCKFNKEFNPNWHCLLKSVNINNNTSHKSKRIDLLSNEYAIIDSSQPYIVAPKKSGLAILEYYRSLYKQCTMYSKYETYTFLVCEGNNFDIGSVPQLCIMLGNKEICFEKDDLFYVGFDELSKKKLFVFKLIVFEFDNDEWKLGLPVFYKRMVMFDNDLNQITFVDVNEMNDNAHNYNRRKYLLRKEETNIFVKKLYIYLIVLTLIMIAFMIGTNYIRKELLVGHRRNNLYNKENINSNETNATELKEIMNI